MFFLKQWELDQINLKHFPPFRHVSTANIDDYSSGDSSEGGARLQHLPRHHSVLDNSFYRSSESLVATDMGEGRGRGQYHLKGSISAQNRAASCSDLLLDLDETRKVC